MLDSTIRISSHNREKDNICVARWNVKEEPEGDVRSKVICGKFAISSAIMCRAKASMKALRND